MIQLTLETPVHWHSLVKRYVDEVGSDHTCP
jgi:hypothetical protein